MTPYLPAPQLEHAEALVEGPKVPAKHRVQLWAPPEAKVPAAQLKQTDEDDDPGKTLYLPPAHGVQRADPVVAA